MPILSWLKVGASRFFADRAEVLEMLWRCSNGLGLTSPMSEVHHTGVHWFAAHFTPIVYVAVWPIFHLSPGHGALIALQTLSLASAVVPIVLYARDKVGSRDACWVGAAYFLFPTLQYINLYGLMYLELCIPLLAWTFYCLHRRWLKAYWIFLLLSLSVREEVGFVVFGLGIYAVVNEGLRGLGGLTAALGLSYSALCLRVIIPSFRSDTSLVYLHNYASWGESPGVILKNLAGHPLWALGKLLTPVRAANMAMYLLPLGFLPLLSPALLAVALPNVLSTLMSDQPSYYSYFLYYLSPTIPFLFLGAVTALARLRHWARAGGPRLRQAGDMLGPWLFLTALSANVFFGPSPISLQFWDRGYRLGPFYTTDFHRSYYRRDGHSAAIRATAARLPQEAAVSAEQHLLPYVYDRRKIMVFPYLDAEADYVLIDKTYPLKTGWLETYLDFRARPAHYYAMIEGSPRWGLVTQADGVMLFRRTSETQ